MKIWVCGTDSPHSIAETVFTTRLFISFGKIKKHVLFAENSICILCKKNHITAVSYPNNSSKHFVLYSSPALESVNKSASITCRHAIVYAVEPVIYMGARGHGGADKGSFHKKMLRVNFSYSLLPVYSRLIEMRKKNNRNNGFDNINGSSQMMNT